MNKFKFFIISLIKVLVSLYVLSYGFLAFVFAATNDNRFSFYMVTIISLLIVFLIWGWKHKKKIIKVFLVITIIDLIAYGIVEYKHYRDAKLTINTNVNIDTSEYLPFDENSKIVRLDHKASLKFDGNDQLPKLDGAAAVFPVYSAFVNAVYPNGVALNFYPFYYSNTIGGYKKLASKDIDIFFGAYPSKEQIEAAKEHGTEFEYTEIGKEGFVFFVNKNNPIDSLTVQQIKDIYSGKITNWKEVGGQNKEIVAFQRNEGSGSQSMLKRFMGDTPIMNPPTTQVNDFMIGIIDQVADYKNYDNSIGFSFRYYLDTLIANPNVKMLAVNGVEPTPENITNGTYPITGSLYAVTYKGNTNENVQKLIDWILSDEGQEIIEKTGYSRVK